MKYKNLVMAILCAAFAGILPQENIIAVKAISFILGMGAGIHLAVFLISLYSEHQKAVTK